MEDKGMDNRGKFHQLLAWMMPLGLCAALAASAGCAPADQEGDFPPAAAPSSDASGRHFAAGMWDVSAGGSASIHRINNEDVDKATTIEASPQLGLFFTDRWEVLASGSVDYQDVKYKKSDAPLAVARTKQADYGGALGLQYNLDEGGKAVPFFRVFGGEVSSHRDVTQTNIPLVGEASQHLETSAPYAGFRVGVRYFMTDKISSDWGIGWKRVWYNDDFGGKTDDTSLTIGVSFLF
jgi:hypothetical protein